jgi:hypothetical protein
MVFEINTLIFICKEKAKVVKKEKQAQCLPW